MAASEDIAGYPVTASQTRGLNNLHVSRKSDDLAPGIQRSAVKDGRSYSGGSAQYGRGGPLAGMATAIAPGGFSTELKSTAFSRGGTPRPDMSVLAMSRIQGSGKEDEALTLSEQRQAIVREKIAKELKIKLGTEKM